MDLQSEFIGAVFTGNLAHAKELVKKGAQIGQDEILHYAAQRGDAAMLTFLLQNGGNEFIDQFDSLAFTPLSWAAKEGRLVAMKILIEAGANVNAVDAKSIGNTALREVVGDGNLEVIELLLTAGADPYIPGWMQMTAVDKAESQWRNVTSPVGKKVLELLKSRRTEAGKILSKSKSGKSKRR